MRFDSLLYSPSLHRYTSIEYAIYDIYKQIQLDSHRFKGSHPANIVLSSQTKYISLKFLTPDLFNVVEKDEFSPHQILPILYNNGNSNRSAISNCFYSLSPYSQFYRKADSNSGRTYYDSSVILDDNGVVYILAIDREYLIEAFKYLKHKLFNDSVLFNFLKDKYATIPNKVVKYIDENIIKDYMEESAFTDILKPGITLIGNSSKVDHRIENSPELFRDISEENIENVPWYRYISKTIYEPLDNYIDSLCLQKVQPFVYSDIHGPEKEALHTFKEFSDTHYDTRYLETA